LLELARRADDRIGWSTTQLPGWCVRDLLFHLAGDAQRALVALAAPSDEPVDTDEVSYWRAWQPGTPGAQAGLRGVRISASAWSSVRGPAELFADTATAVLAMAARSSAAATVSTQGHRLSVDALLRTLAVEAVVHHLDLGAVLPEAPAPEALDEVRRVLDGLSGRPAPAGWTTERYIRVATGREPLTAEDRVELGPLADRLPLFG
jgi:hypothetical protein